MGGRDGQGARVAVAHAHERQVVHRDLKPANVLLADGDGDPVLKVTDFGLAKRLDTESTAFTQDGAVLGTAGYMAPEQAAGRTRDIGPGVDIYAMGAILYEALTGRPPFRAETWPEAIRRVLQDEPVPPSRLAADVPGGLEAICLKCLEKDPARRYETAAELADDLGRFLDGARVNAVPVDAATRLARAAERDGYRIVAEIGRGPCGTVYQATAGSLGQPVAVKVFPAGGANREVWEERLRRGTAAWSALSHPHVVPVRGSGWWDDAPFLAVEYVPNGSLAARRLDGRPTIRQVLRVVTQLAETIVYLHRQGVVYGNLKPSNVLLAGDGIPRLTDLGITGEPFRVRPADDAEPPAGLGGLAPELVDDPEAEPRPHTDVYGLGVILYELLTGLRATDRAAAVRRPDRGRGSEASAGAGPGSAVAVQLAGDR